jgi:hypothetical protein
MITIRGANVGSIIEWLACRSYILRVYLINMILSFKHERCESRGFDTHLEYSYFRKSNFFDVLYIFGGHTACVVCFEVILLARLTFHLRYLIFDSRRSVFRHKCPVTYSLKTLLVNIRCSICRWKRFQALEMIHWLI